MRPDVRSWVVKAERDYRTALALSSRLRPDYYESAGFHSQQCVEKYLKAYMTLHRIPYGRVHDLAVLLRTAASKDNALLLHERRAAPLNRFAVLFRYPGAEPRRRDVVQALRALRVLRRELRRQLGLNP